MPTMRFGKPSLPLLLQKTSFFDENEVLLKKQRETASAYRQQPLRVKCINCNAPIGMPTDFIKDGIGYVICSNCSHLNGLFEGTEKFFSELYSSDSGEDYAKTFYKVANQDKYNYRTASIYIPKAEFLYTSLLNQKDDPHRFEYFDFGAGSGYFISALKKLGLKNISGTDVSKSQVDYGNDMIGEALLKTHEMKDTEKVLSECPAQVVSMIGVLEHLQNPQGALRAICNNKNVQYLYILVPTLSLSVFLEIFSPNIFHRHLTGGHTHLYTRGSLSHLCNQFGLEVIAEWWFGTDMVDLFRHISVDLRKQDCSERLLSFWKREFIPLLDALQMELDKNLFSSEVHMVLQKKLR